MIRTVVFVFLTCIIISGCQKKVNFQETVDKGNAKGKETQELALQMLDGTTRLFEGVRSYHGEDTALIADSSYQVRDYKITFTRLANNKIDIEDSAKNISELKGYGGAYMGNSETEVTEKVGFYFSINEGGYVYHKVTMIFNTKTNKVQSFSHVRSGRILPVGEYWEKLELKEQ